MAPGQVIPISTPSLPSTTSTSTSTLITPQQGKARKGFHRLASFLTRSTTAIRSQSATIENDTDAGPSRADNGTESSSVSVSSAVPCHSKTTPIAHEMMKNQQLQLNHHHQHQRPHTTQEDATPSSSVADGSTAKRPSMRCSWGAFQHTRSHSGSVNTLPRIDSEDRLDFFGDLGFDQLRHPGRDRDRDRGAEIGANDGFGRTAQTANGRPCNHENAEMERGSRAERPIPGGWRGEWEGSADARMDAERGTSEELRILRQYTPYFSDENWSAFDARDETTTSLQGAADARAPRSTRESTSSRNGQKERLKQEWAESDAGSVGESVTQKRSRYRRPESRQTRSVPEAETSKSCSALSSRGQEQDQGRDAVRESHKDRSNFHRAISRLMLSSPVSQQITTTPPERLPTPPLYQRGNGPPASTDKPKPCRARTTKVEPGDTVEEIRWMEAMRRDTRKFQSVAEMQRHERMRRPSYTSTQSGDTTCQTNDSSGPSSYGRPHDTLYSRSARDKQQKQAEVEEYRKRCGEFITRDKTMDRQSIDRPQSMNMLMGGGLGRRPVACRVASAPNVPLMTRNSSSRCLNVVTSAGHLRHSPYGGSMHSFTQHRQATEGEIQPQPTASSSRSDSRIGSRSVTGFLDAHGRWHPPPRPVYRNSQYFQQEQFPPEHRVGLASSSAGSSGNLDRLSPRQPKLPGRLEYLHMHSSTADQESLFDGQPDIRPKAPTEQESTPLKRPDAVHLRKRSLSMPIMNRGLPITPPYTPGTSEQTSEDAMTRRDVSTAPTSSPATSSKDEPSQNAEADEASLPATTT